jgi:hypothetical protein
MPMSPMTVQQQGGGRSASKRQAHHLHRLLAIVDTLQLDATQLDGLARLPENKVCVLSAELAEILPRLGLVRAVRGGYLITPRGIAARKLLKPGDPPRQ